MRERTIRQLAWVPYDAAAIDGKLSDLAALLHESAVDAPSCGPAALNVTKLRYALRATLKAIDDEVTEAVLAAEAIEAPF